MRLIIDEIEQQRLALQADLDAKKTQAERNRLGQFATPTPLAVDILKCAYSLIPQKEKVRFLDPAIGTGTFYSALLKVFPKDQTETALGFEIDPHYGDPSAFLWKDSGLKLKLADFTHERGRQDSRRYFICNDDTGACRRKTGAPVCYEALRYKPRRGGEESH
jgi:adenine-specific DNA-methyltransferase